MVTADRYRNCADDCTTDCGHCKGDPPPKRTVWAYKNHRFTQEPKDGPVDFTTERRDELELYSITIRAYTDEEACAIARAEHKRDARFILMRGVDTR